MILATCLALLIACPGWLQVDNELEITPEGIQFIKEKEELVLFVYDDGIYPPEKYEEGQEVKGTLTIGYGHTGALKKGGKEAILELVGKDITKEEADELFEEDLQEVQRIVNTRIKRHLKLPKFIENYGMHKEKDIELRIVDYLVITAFNKTGLNDARILGHLINGNVDKAHALTVKGYGKQGAGIVKRLDDQKLFYLGEYDLEDEFIIDIDIEKEDDQVEDDNEVKEQPESEDISSVPQVKIDEGKEELFESQVPKQAGPFTYTQFRTQDNRYQIEKDLRNKFYKTYTDMPVQKENTGVDLYDRIKRTFSGKFVNGNAG